MRPTRGAWCHDDDQRRPRTHEADTQSSSHVMLEEAYSERGQASSERTRARSAWGSSGRERSVGRRRWKSQAEDLSEAGLAEQCEAGSSVRESAPPPTRHG